MTILVNQAVKHILKQCPNFKPKVAVVLGSGLGNFANKLTNAATIPFKDIPGFPELTVPGHQAEIVCGKLANQEIICLKGRPHYYEGATTEQILTYVRTLRLLGCQYFIATNASGSLHADMPPGEIMLITDHINFQGVNPLVGANDEKFGPRFFPLDNAYDIKLRDQFLKAATVLNVPLHQGVYVCVMGPNYETAAEIKAFRMLGADAVGMSTVPEVLVANHCGMQVAALATITNFATGLTSLSHSHTEVLQIAEKATAKLAEILYKVLPSLV
ncbi:MAG: purine-nucleoside phosphorylase [Legionellales bacterium RIFCSPHIGHO2_12_FULL_37_14]|nr:MAG: purine-nucleoside phosphorylase [Legionellales bacterium RIFCSPHIGHO2_12_FULL_37_14]